MPEFYKVHNPTDPQFKWKTTTISGNIIDAEIKMQIAEYAAYETDKLEYEASVKAYLDALARKQA